VTWPISFAIDVDAQKGRVADGPDSRQPDTPLGEQRRSHILEKPLVIVRDGAEHARVFHTVVETQVRVFAATVGRFVHSQIGDRPPEPAMQPDALGRRGEKKANARVSSHRTVDALLANGRRDAVGELPTAAP
jgi:hypothetical protein